MVSSDSSTPGIEDNLSLTPADVLVERSVQAATQMFVVRGSGGFDCIQRMGFTHRAAQREPR